MVSENIILSCTGLQKSFVVEARKSPALVILKGIDLEVNKGEVVSIVGASGSGKSTLLHILGGLDRPSAGQVFWSGEDIGSWSDDRLARARGANVGFVFQFHHLLPEFSALENVMIPQMIAGKKDADAKRHAEELLVKVGLEQRVGHKPSELSGGEQQRVAVARALANNPGIIFADEPSGNLDSENSDQLHALLQHLNATEHQTFVIVTHNQEFAARSHRVFRMADGLLKRM